MKKYLAILILLFSGFAFADPPLPRPGPPGPPGLAIDNYVFITLALISFVAFVFFKRKQRFI